MTDAATHTDSGMPIVSFEDMMSAVNLTLGDEPDKGPKLLEAYGAIMEENPVILANIMSATDTMMRARGHEVAGAFLVGFVQCYVALRNAETRYRKG